MSFIIDKQTLNDLGIFSRNKDMSVYGIYNTTHTRGGAQLLEEMFQNPLDSCELIRRRSDLIGFFKDEKTVFPFRASWFDSAEFYLSDKDIRTRIFPEGNSLQHKFRHLTKTDTEYRQLQNGILSVISIIRTLNKFLDEMEGKAGRSTGKNTEQIRDILSSEDFSVAANDDRFLKPDPEQTAFLDSKFRYERNDDIRKILDYIYHLDVYISAAEVAADRGFVRAEALSPDQNIMEITGLRHPMLVSPVDNNLSITGDNNVIFLTGANMAGKSTFMKAFGIAVFLAHVGFPVPAASMRFSVRDGMYSTINLPDCLNQGYSHFYAEVRRLKKVALCLKTYRNMVIIFDELFRGTNVRDAYDATVAVTEAFANIHGSIFVISTHIIEAGEKLKSLCGNILFVYLPTVMEGDRPKYTYRLQEGITADRHGMVIIRNEGILDILNN